MVFLLRSPFFPYPLSKKFINKIPFKYITLSQIILMNKLKSNEINVYFGWISSQSIKIDLYGYDQNLLLPKIFPQCFLFKI